MLIFLGATVKISDVALKQNLRPSQCLNLSESILHLYHEASGV